MILTDRTEELEPDFDMYNIREVMLNDQLIGIQKLEKKENLMKLINETRMKATEHLFNNEKVSFEQKFLFKNPTGLFLINNAVAILNEVSFRIRYFRTMWNFQIDRGEHYPVVIHNVISKSITPIKKEQNSYEMLNTVNSVPVDLENKPTDVIGRDGVSAKLLISLPMNIESRKADDETYELVNSNNKLYWQKI